MPDMESILILLGQYFQIRDVYMNLASREVCNLLRNKANINPTSTPIRRAFAKT
jgi:hypothetical protein